MSNYVDVLAVMDAAAAEAICRRTGARPSAELVESQRSTLMEARAAVAELIEAAARASGDHSAPHDCYATGPLTGDTYRDLISCPGCELSAALARVTGRAE